MNHNTKPTSWPFTNKAPVEVKVEFAKVNQDLSADDVLALLMGEYEEEVLGALRQAFAEHGQYFGFHHYFATDHEFHVDLNTGTWHRSRELKAKLTAIEKEFDQPDFKLHLIW